MYGIYINDDYISFTSLILLRTKLYETRSRDMLKRLVGKRVALISTSRKREPLVVGYATIRGKGFCPAQTFDLPYIREYTCIPKGSKYDCKGKGKWLYRMEDPESCEPYSLPENIERHGRSYCYIPGKNF